MKEYKPIQQNPAYLIGTDGSVWRGGVQLKCCTNNYGYKYIRVQTPNGRRNLPIAVLVLETFVGPRPPGCHARHYDDPDQSNNNLSNLRWGTPLENAQDSIRHGTKTKGGCIGASKLTEADVAEICRGLMNEEPMWRMAKKYGVGISSICDIRRGKSWAWLTGASGERPIDKHWNGYGSGVI